MNEKLQMPNKVPDDVQCLTPVDKIFYQIHNRWTHNQVLIELKSDKGEEESFYPHPNLYEIKLLKYLMLLKCNFHIFYMGYEGEFSIKYNPKKF